MGKKLTMEQLNRLNCEEFKQAEKVKLAVVLDNVRSVHNVGSVFRTVDAFRLSRLYLCGITAVPPSPEIHKTALGAEDSVEWRYEADTLEALRQLRREGYTIFAAEQAEGSLRLSYLDLSQLFPLGSLRIALVLGHEVKGVAQAVVDASDYIVEIPQFGTKHSLNVSVSAGILIWEFVRQLGFPTLTNTPTMCSGI